MSVVVILVVVIIGFLLAIAILIARILWHKSQTALQDQYRQIRYEKYSRLIDETIAEKPGAVEKPEITKQVGDEEVLEDLIHTKLENVKGADRSRVAAKIKEIGLTTEYEEGLSSPDPVKRARSLEVLGDLRVIDESDRFLHALSDDDRDVRLTAARGLANIIDELKITGPEGEEKWYHKSVPYGPGGSALALCQAIRKAKEGEKDVTVTDDERANLEQRWTEDYPG